MFGCVSVTHWFNCIPGYIAIAYVAGVVHLCGMLQWGQDVRALSGLLVCLGRTFKSACLGLSISKLSLCVYLRCCIVLGVWTMCAFLTLFLNVYRRCSIRLPPILGAAGGSCVRCVSDEWFSCFIRLMHTCRYGRCDGFARMIGACLYF